ncbi:uncharacterized protein LOC144753768 [Lissotriton helveticus]
MSSKEPSDKSSSFQGAAPSQTLHGDNTATTTLTDCQEELEGTCVLDLTPVCEDLLLRISSFSSSTESLECRQPEEHWEGDSVDEPSSHPLPMCTATAMASFQKDCGSSFYHSPNLFSDKESTEPSIQNSDPPTTSQEEKVGDHNSVETISNTHTAPRAIYFSGVPCIDQVSCLPGGEKKEWIRAVEKRATKSQEKECTERGNAEITDKTLEVLGSLWSPSLDENSSLTHGHGKELKSELQKEACSRQNDASQDYAPSKTNCSSNFTACESLVSKGCSSMEVGSSLPCSQSKDLARAKPTAGFTYMVKLGNDDSSGLNFHIVSNQNHITSSLNEANAYPLKNNREAHVLTTNHPLHCLSFTEDIEEPMSKAYSNRERMHDANKESGSHNRSASLANCRLPSATHVKDNSIQGAGSFHDSVCGQGEELRTLTCNVQTQTWHPKDYSCNQASFLGPMAMYCCDSNLNTTEQKKETGEAIGSMALNAGTSLEDFTFHCGSLRNDSADCKSDPQSLPVGQGNLFWRETRGERESPPDTVGSLDFSGASSVRAFACLLPAQGQACRETNVNFVSTETTSLEDTGIQEAPRTRSFNRLESLHPCLVSEGREVISSCDPATITSPCVTSFPGASCANETTINSQDCKPLMLEQLEGWKTVMREERRTFTSKTSAETLNSMEASYIARDTSTPTREVCMTENQEGRGYLSIKNFQEAKGSNEASCTGGDPSDSKSLTPGQREACRTEITEGEGTPTSGIVQKAISTSGSFCMDKTISSSPDSMPLPPNEHGVWTAEASGGKGAVLEFTGSFEASCIGRDASISSDCTSLAPGQGEASGTETSEGMGALTSSPNFIEAVSFSRGPSIPNDLTLLNPGQPDVCRTEISEQQLSLTTWPSHQTGRGRLYAHQSPPTSVCSGSMLTSFHIHRAHKRHLEQAEDHGDADTSPAPKKTMATLPSLQGEAVQEKMHYTSSHRTGQWSVLPLNSPRMRCRSSGVAGTREVYLYPLASGRPALAAAQPRRSAPRNLELLLLKNSKGNMQLHRDETPFRYTYPAPSRALQDTALGIRCPPSMIHWALQYLNTSGGDTGRQSPPRNT